MKRIVYKSRARGPMGERELETLLSTSRKNNERDHISGMLIYAEGVFLQCLEGPLSEVDACFNRIKDDPRHGDVEIVSEQPTQTRMFPDWTMGYSNVVCSDVATLLALHDMTTIADGRVDEVASRRILEHFGAPL